MSDFIMAIKQLLRPLIPDAVMARYRVRQHSLGMRTNVDVFLRDGRDAKRWLQLTPDTYRVVSGSPRADSAEGAIVLGEKGGSLGDFMGFGGVDVVVAGETLRPAMYGLRVVEPTVVPRSILVTLDAIEEVGGIEDNSDDLVRTYQRLADAGRRVGLAPTIVDTLPATSRTPVMLPAAIVFAAVPLHDIGGGSRAAQITFELLRSGFHVTYVAMYPSAEGVDLGLRFIHPFLEQHRIEVFSVEDIDSRANAGIVILEAPAEPFVEPARELQDRGWKVIFDIIDDWTDASLGGFWYKPEVDQEIVTMADAVVASAPDLVRHGIELGSETALIPNAVNADLFGPVATESPVDLPSGELIGYVGSLYGEWFDWGALESIAKAFPDATIVVIGDDHYKRPMPENVVYLGLKAQEDLPAYIQRFDVGIVPFELSEVTHAVSPLKVYEYLASGVPVAAPPLRALEGLDGVYTDVDLVGAVTQAMQASKPDRERALEEHSWHERLGRLLASVGDELPDAVGPPMRIARRVPAHYSKADRSVQAQ